MNTKEKPSIHDCYAKLENDEPYFVLKATDVLAPAIIRMWIQLRRVTKKITPAEMRKQKEAESIATSMEVWRIHKERKETS